MPERSLLRRLQDETGSALIASLMMTVLITGAGLAAMTTSASNQSKTTNVLINKQAAYLAEAGLNHGKLLLHQNILNWSTYAAYTTAQSFVPSTTLAGVGSYAVTIKGVSGGVLLTATGTGPKSATESISTLATLDNGNMLGKAFVTGQSLLISGSPTFTGTSGGIHANGNLTISGNPVISSGNAARPIDAEATGTYTVTGSPTIGIGGYAGGNQPKHTINSLTASQLSSAYDYYFTYCYNSDDATYHGCVYDRSWNLKADVANGGTASFDGNACWQYTSYSYSGGWTWNSTLWMWVYTPYTYTPFIWTATCKPIDATYYVNGDVVISGSISPGGTPTWVTTILAAGSIKVTSANLVVRPPLSTEATYKSLTQDLLFVASKDILIEGNNNQSFTGIMSAYEQVGISGNPVVPSGYVLAQDISNAATSPYGSNLVGSNYISGNMSLTYNGALKNSRQGNAVFQATLY